MNDEALFSERRKRLLRCLTRCRDGVSVDELGDSIGVTRTAVRQHLAALIREGLVEPGRQRPSRGRPIQLFALTDAGRESFPRHYSWFAQMLVEAITEEHGTAGLRTRLGRIAAAALAQLEQQAPRPETREERIERVATVMDQLGYDARAVPGDGALPDIEADNCVFHELATKQPEICQFDIALISGYTGGPVELHECAARGGHVCRFKFTSPR
jgi:predicted ArsR family transcriptional regulator